MAQLFFKYGAMNSGKTIEILKVAHNYEEQNKPVVLMTSGLDTREGVGTISSRIGLSRPAVPIFSETNIFDFIEGLDYKPYCILIDESQFLSKAHVVQLAQVEKRFSKRNVRRLKIFAALCGQIRRVKNDLLVLP